ncbi:MAG TPA: alpha/beta fold hydrolase [Dongiaceae bacterium]|nr:alpha/beta fold hydrolase [Dongiaceae bacterium]
MRRAVILLLLFLGACAPRLQAPGTDAAVPALAADHLVMADGVQLPLRIWLPAGQPKAVILALHGINDYSNAFEAPATRWASAGIATYAYDQRGFGETQQRGLWPGEARLVDDLRTAAALIAARHPGVPLYLLGESMGGAVVMAAAASPQPPQATGLILAAPAIWGRETQGPLQSSLLWTAAHTMPWMTLTGRGLNIKPSDNIDMLRKLSRDPLVIKETRVDTLYGLVNLMDSAYEAAPRLPPHTLILYGSREDVMPESAVLSMLHRLPPRPADRPLVALYPRGYHMLLRDLDAGIVLDDIAAWISHPGAPLPSGGDQLAAAVLASGHDSLKVDADMVQAEKPGTAIR